ncbi:MAG: hypothetical protein KBA15_12555, partial [Spirochaetes bacterium]|nr:hypothetical protein [Spirochaetota bacterium]
MRKRWNGLALPALIFFAVLFSTGAAGAPGAEVLTLGDFLEKATRSNPDIFAQLQRLGESEALEQQSRAVYDIVFNLHYS